MFKNLLKSVRCKSINKSQGQIPQYSGIAIKNSSSRGHSSPRVNSPRSLVVDKPPNYAASLLLPKNTTLPKNNIVIQVLWSELRYPEFNASEATMASRIISVNCSLQCSCIKRPQKPGLSNIHCSGWNLMA